MPVASSKHPERGDGASGCSHDERAVAATALAAVPTLGEALGGEHAEPAHRIAVHREATSQCVVVASQDFGPVWMLF